MFKKIEESTQYLKQKINKSPELGIILGTGLSGLTNEIAIEHTIPYEEIPYFPTSTIESHKGQLIFGKLGDKQIVAMQGRFHYYEGYDLKEVTFPVRVMKMLGIETLLISNAAGSLNPDIPKESLMMVTDHINLLPQSPLVGENIVQLGPRFPDMGMPYDENLRKKALEIGEAEDLNMKKGVYVSGGGPNLETPAEYRYLRTIGADAVGMSTVPEVIVARHMQIPVLAFSVITDECFYSIPEPLTLEMVIETAEKTEPKLTLLMKKLVEKI